MRICSGFFIVLGLAFLTGCMPPKAQEENHVRNPDFELSNQDARHWHSHSWDGSSAGIALSTEAKTGVRSLHIVHTKNNDTVVVQLVPVEPDTVYRVSGWIKAKNIEPATSIGAALTVFETWVRSPDIKTSDDWSPVEFYIQTAESQRRLALACRLGFWSNLVSGEAWFDDIRMTAMDPLPRGAQIHAVTETHLHDDVRYETRVALLGGSILLILFALWFLLKRGPSPAWSFVFVFLAFGLIYGLSSYTVGQGPFRRSQFPHYVHLADALLNGRLHILQMLPEVQLVNEKIYLIVPLLPGVLMMPFVALFGMNFYDTLFLLILSAFNMGLVYSLWPKVNRYFMPRLVSQSGRYWLTLLFGLGTPYWYLSIGGRVWHTEAITAQFFLLLAVHEALGRNRSLLTGLFLGMAFLCHPPIVFGLPFFAGMLGFRLWKEKKAPLKVVLKSFFLLFFVLGLEIAVGWGLYNYVRYGNFFDAGLRQGVSPGQSLFGLHYIAQNFRLGVLRLPSLTNTFPFLSHDAAGFSLFVATPAFVSILWAFKKNVLIVMSWLSAIMILLCLMSFHWSGATQFGYRFVNDALVFLVFLAALGLSRLNAGAARFLIPLSVAVNFLGMIWFYQTH